MKAINVLFLSCFSLVVSRASLAEDYNNPDISERSSARKVVACLSSVEAITKDSLTLQTNFELFGNSNFENAEVVLFPDSHIGMDTRLLYFKAIREVAKPGDILFFEDVDLDMNLPSEQCDFLKELLILTPSIHSTDSDLNGRRSRYMTALRKELKKHNSFYSQNIALQLDLKDVLKTPSLCAGWDSLHHVELLQQFASQSEMTLDQLIQHANLKSIAIAKKARTLPRFTAGVGVIDYMRHKNLIKAIQKHRKTGRRIFILLGIAHAPHMHKFFKRNQLASYEFAISIVEEFTAKLNYIVLQDKKLTPDLVSKQRLMNQEEDFFEDLL